MDLIMVVRVYAAAIAAIKENADLTKNSESLQKARSVEALTLSHNPVISCRGVKKRLPS
jgi:hypothetical protein